MMRVHAWFCCTIIVLVVFYTTSCAGDRGYGAANSASPGNGGTTSDGASGADAGPTCLTNREFFVERLWLPVLSPRCLGCHHADGQAGDSNFVMTFGRDDAELEANFLAVEEIARRESGGTSVLLLKPTDQHEIPHTGGAPVEIDSADYRSLQAFVERVTGGEDECEEPDEISCEVPWPGHRRVRRLTHREYNRTISDLFGERLDYGTGFSPDTVIGGYDNQSDALVASPLLVEQWFQAAEDIADRLVADAPEELLGCESPDRVCVESFLGTIGARAFRRPWTEQEIATYADLYDAIATEDGDAEGLKSVLIALLMSPHFLYRTELGREDDQGRWVLTPFEVAQELSYLIWGTLPDEALWQEAVSDGLRTPEQIALQVQRMIDDPKTTERFVGFVHQWVDIDLVSIVARDETIFDTFDASIRAAMIEETDRFLVHTFDSGRGDLATLLSSPFQDLSPELATFYGTPNGSTDPERPGLLGRGSLLATYALPTQSSPIHRGKLVRELLLCQPLAPPPPNIEADAPPIDRSLTTRERFQQHATDPVCGSCHRLIDPIGFGFEHFDAVGRYRADNFGLPIDALGEIVDSPSTDGTFDGLVELSSLLSSSRDVSDCFSTHWTRFSYGLDPDTSLTCSSAELQRAFAESGGRFESLLVALTQTNHFRYRAPEEVAPHDGFGTRSTEQEQADMGLDIGVDATDGDDAAPMIDAEVDLAVIPDLAPPAEIEVTITTGSDWQAGYCNDVIVRNISTSSVDWVVEIEIEGVMTDHWSSEASGTSNQVRFEGVAWNNVLDPGNETTFGYCAQR